MHIFFVTVHKALLMSKRERVILQFSLPDCTNGIQDRRPTMTVFYLSQLLSPVLTP